LISYLFKKNNSYENNNFDFFFSLLSGLTNAQKLKEAELPEAVKKSFAEKFKNVMDVKWSKENATEFEAEFKIGKQEQSANFDQTGKLLVKEYEIKESEVPHAVQATISKEFAGYKIEEVEKAESSDKGNFYEVELKNGKQKYEVQISPEGKVLKKEEVKKD